MAKGALEHAKAEVCPDTGLEHWCAKLSNMLHELLIRSTGNFHRDEAADFLRGFSSVLTPGDTMLVGLDSCLDPVKVL